LAQSLKHVQDCQIDQDVWEFERLFLLTLHGIAREDSEDGVIAKPTTSVELRPIYAIGIAAITAFVSHILLLEI
jgi:hypothetical protein